MQKVRSFINRNFQTFVTFWALALTGLILWGFHDLRAQTDQVKRQNAVLRQQAVQLKRQTADIQKSRLESCERGYEGTRSVFKPFFPADPKKYTPQQKKFQKIIDRLKEHCAIQTGVGTNP